MLHSGRFDLPTVDVMTPNYKRRWWLIRTGSKQERELAWDMQARDLAYFLPLIQIRGVRKERLLAPMFTGYMFLYGTVQNRYDLLKVNQTKANRVVQVLDFDDQATLHWELVTIARVLESGLELRVMQHLSRGDLCEIIDGSLIGQVGRVDKVSDDELWVSLWVSMLGQSISVKLPRVRVKLAAQEVELVHG